MFPGCQLYTNVETKVFHVHDAAGYMMTVCVDRTVGNVVLIAVVTRAEGSGDGGDVSTAYD